jgi:zinc D-Ala-D-Ala dipeptidase
MSASGAEQPSFDTPTFTVACSQVFQSELPGIDAPRALPRLTDSEGSEVEKPVDEPLVRVEHRRIRTLANYWHGGWDHAIPVTWLRVGVADRLYTVADALPARWGLAVFDGWRPLALQRELYEVAIADPAIEPGFMAPVSNDPAIPPPHLTGGAVDLTLTFDSVPLAPGCGFDDTTSRAHVADLEEQPGPDRAARRFLYWSMRAAGFVVFEGEWWHFEFGTRRWSLLTGGTSVYGPTSPAS